jgi:hypothetical protein
MGHFISTGRIITEFPREPPGELSREFPRELSRELEEFSREFPRELSRDFLTRYYRIRNGNHNRNNDLIVILQNPATPGNQSDITTNLLEQYFSDRYRNIYIVNITAIVTREIRSVYPLVNNEIYDEIHKCNLTMIKKIIELTQDSHILLACGQDFTRCRNKNIFKRNFVEIFNILTNHRNKFYIRNTIEPIIIDQNITIRLPYHIRGVRREETETLIQYQDEYVII